MSKIVPLEGFGGGGSSPLNFKIVAYATEEELAAAQPKENTIGVVTTTPINGYSFNATEPANPVEGMVWISTGIYSNVEFNALKENSIQVYPISAKQYVSGKWVNKTAKNYQGGTWVNWITYLFDDGNKFTTITGGWVGNYTCDPGQYGFSMTPGYIEDGSLVLEGDALIGAVMGTSKSVDLTPYNTLYFEGYQSSIAGNGTGHTLGVSTSKNVSDEVAGVLTTKVGSFKKSVSVKALTGKYYIFAYSGFAAECMGSINRIWLE